MRAQTHHKDRVPWAAKRSGATTQALAATPESRYNRYHEPGQCGAFRAFGKLAAGGVYVRPQLGRPPEAIKAKNQGNVPMFPRRAEGRGRGRQGYGRGSKLDRGGSAWGCMAQTIPLGDWET